MPEVAINVPFDSNEIKDIAVAEFRKRLDGLGPLQGAKEYAKFALEFAVKIRVWRTGETGAGKDTLAWGNVAGAPSNPTPATMTIESADVSGDKFESKDPNTERQDRDMPLTVETTDGKGGKTRRKAKVKR